MVDVPAWKAPLYGSCNLPILLISLADQAQRRSDLIKRGVPEDWVLRYFPATDLRNATADAIEPLADLSRLERRIRRPLHSAEVGCAMSHRSAARWLAGSGHQLALVLEDDVVPQTADWIQRTSLIAQALISHAWSGRAFVCLLGARPDQADSALKRQVVWRGGIPPAGLPQLYLHTDPSQELWRAHAYLISHAAARLTTERETRIMTLADDWNLRQSLGQIHELFYTRPILVGQDEDRPSTIRPPIQIGYERLPKELPFLIRVGRALQDGSFEARSRSFLRLRTSLALAKLRSRSPYKVWLRDMNMT